MQSMKKYAAEFIGTFFLLFIGTGAIIVNKISNNELGHMGVAFVFGFVIVIMIYATGHISGAHFNPAVTIAFAVVGKFSKKEVIPYIVSQLLGAISASMMLRAMFSSVCNCNLACTQPALAFGSKLVTVAFVIEFIYTLCLMFVIMSVATDSRAEGSFAGLAIGLTVFVGASVAGPITGGSFNPARSIAPALLSGDLNYLWIYIVAPISGAICAAIGYKFIGNINDNKVDQAITKNENL